MKVQDWASVRMEREHLIFTGLPAFTLLFIFTPWRPVQFLALFFIILILFSRLYSEYLIRHLCIRRRDIELRGFRNDWIDVELIAENHGRLTAFTLILGDTPGMLAVFRGNKSICTLRGRSRTVIRWQGYGTSRGLYCLGPAQLRGSDPIGLFPFTLSASDTSRLFVYPSPGFINIKAPRGIPLGVLVSANPFNEDLTRRRSLREYSGGDELRRINWKASSRISTGEGLMVNEYEATLSYPLVLFLNADPSEYPPKNRELYLERAIEAAAALCLMASRERQALGLMVHCSPQDRGEIIYPAAFTHISILERLAVLERPKDSGDENGLNQYNTEHAGNTANTGSTARAGSTERILEEGKLLPFGTRLVYIGPSLDNEDHKLLEGMKSAYLSLEYLVIDERTLPPLARRYQMKERGYEIL